MSCSAEELVNRMADLIAMLRTHYKPDRVMYRAGAFVNPEPLGGHIHFGWAGRPAIGSNEYNARVWRVMELISAWQAMGDFLEPRLWDQEEIQNRVAWARNNRRRDFGARFSVRPEGGVERIMAESHFEFRFLPSWLATPEAAYAALGGAEVLAREVISSSIGTNHDWPKFVAAMYSGSHAPAGGLTLDRPLAVASRFKVVEDFAPNW
jgi:hypothetical protein